MYSRPELEQNSGVGDRPERNRLLCGEIFAGVEMLSQQAFATAVPFIICRVVYRYSFPGGNTSVCDTNLREVIEVLLAGSGNG